MIGVLLIIWKITFEKESFAIYQKNSVLQLSYCKSRKPQNLHSDAILNTKNISFNICPNENLK